jgi:hypothetical protein
MNNFVWKFGKKFDLDKDLVCYAKILLKIYTVLLFHEQIELSGKYYTKIYIISLRG